MTTFSGSSQVKGFSFVMHLAKEMIKHLLSICSIFSHLLYHPPNKSFRVVFIKITSQTNTVCFFFLSINYVAYIVRIFLVR